MVHFLIVEDNSDTLELLNDSFGRYFPEAVIHTATTVQEAIQRIQTATAERFNYKVAVLDYKIPESVGENPEVHTSWRSQLLETMSRDDVVIDISSYITDTKVTKHIVTERLQKPQSPRSLVVGKLDSNWADTLYQLIGQVVYGARIEDQFERLFGRPTEVDGSLNEARPRWNTSADPTHDLADLMRDIETYWKFLDESLKKKIRTGMALSCEILFCDRGCVSRHE